VGEVTKQKGKKVGEECSLCDHRKVSESDAAKDRRAKTIYSIVLAESLELSVSMQAGTKSALLRSLGLVFPQMNASILR